MNLESTTQFEILLSKLAFSDDQATSGWTFSLADDYIIRFQPFGSLNTENFKFLAESFDRLQSEYFKDADFLIFLFDFSNFKKAPSDVRSQIIEGNLFKDERVSFVAFGMNYFVSTIAKVISNRLVSKRMFVVKNEAAGLETAKLLISNFRLKRVKELQRPDYYLHPENTIEIGDKSYTVLSRQAWTYNDPTSDYAYKIDLIDDNILVARPSGYIKYQNSVMANVLFDKVVNSELKEGAKYYRIQDYTAVKGSENKARRDFSDYIINGIDRINLVIFYGLNRTMKTVVRLGKLVYPAFEKIRIADTFEEALERVISDKYKTLPKEITKIKQDEEPKYESSQEEIVDLKAQKAFLAKENDRFIRILFDRISEITFGASKDYVPVKMAEDSSFYDLFGAVHLLYEDFDELKNDRNAIRFKLQKILSEQAEEIKGLKIDNSSKLKAKNDFIRNTGHELSLSLEAILNAIQLLHQEEKTEVQKSLFEIVKMASITLQDGIRQLKSNIADNYINDVVSETMFNYRKNIVQLVEVSRMGYSGGNVIFENTVEDNLPTFLIGDKRKLNQIVNIYLENAIKYTRNGFIKVYTHTVSKTATQTRFRLIVEDSGIGIDKYIKPHIFKDISVENGDADNTGRGFGLLIAKNLAQILGAEVGFESEKGVGSKFWLELTLNIGYHDKVSQMHAVRNHRSKAKKSLPFEGNNALLIMDDDIRRNLLVQVLRKKGIQSRAKMNYEFFEDIEGKFDYVFICLQLTGGKELSSFKILKNTIDAKNDFLAPVYIACVDTTIDPILEDYRRAGVDYFLNRSFKIREIDNFFEGLK